MPRKQVHTKEEIIETAFRYLRKHGSVSARKLADEMSCSVIPIYSSFDSMDELQNILFTKAKNVLLEYQTSNYTNMNFLDMGIGYIRFAQQETKLFGFLFQEEKSMQKYWDELFDDIFKVCLDSMKQIPFLQKYDDKHLNGLLFDIWIFTHGLASLLNANAIKVKSEEEIVTLLRSIARKLLASIDVVEINDWSKVK